MFNIGGGELLVIMVIALLVLGPDKLPEAARKFGNVLTELRRMSSGFRQELEGALDVKTEAEARNRGRSVSRPPEGASTLPQEPSAATGETGDGIQDEAPARPAPRDGAAVDDG